MIRVHRNGEDHLLTIPEFEAMTGAAFIQRLAFAEHSFSEDLRERMRKLHKKGELTQEQIWLGAYYKKEIEAQPAPAVTIRWIDDSIGWGVFADQALKKGTFVAEYCGIVRPRRRQDKHNSYCFEYAAAPHIPTPYTIDAQDQGGIGRFINHSSRPNLRSSLATLEWINHVILIVDKPIAKGEQLCYDYGPDYWSNRSKPKDFEIA